jgi:hypothetical protein
MTEPIRARVGSDLIELRPPAEEQFALRAAIWEAAGRSAIFASAAALAACWRGPGRPKASWAACKGDGSAFGSRVLEELHARGVTLRCVSQVGGAALGLLCECIIREQEVQEQADFFVEAGGSTSTSSRSAEPGGSSQAGGGA